MRPRTITDGIVTLAPITIETAKTFPKWIDDEDVARFLGHYDSIPDEKQEEAWYQRTIESKTDYVWEVHFQGKVVGISGIHKIDSQGWATTGTIIGDKSAWKQQVGTRSMILRAKFAFQKLDSPLNVLVTHVFTSNIGGMKATDSCGYIQTGLYPNRYNRNSVWHDVAIKLLTKEHFEEILPNLMRKFA